MNDTLEAISVQRLNRAVKSVVHAVPGSLSSVDSESGQLDASAKSSLTTPVVSSVAGSVIGMQPPQSFMLSLDMAGLPVVPGHSAPDRTIIPGFPLPDMQNFPALKPKRLAPYTGPMSLSQIISGDHTLPRLQPMPPHVLAPAVPSLSAVPPYHPSTAVLASSVPISNLPSLPHPTVRFPQQPPPHSAPSQLQVLGNLPSSSYVTCFLPPPVVPPSSSKAPAMTLSHTSHLQLLVPQHMNGLPPSGPLSPATTQLLQSAIEAESIDSGLPAYHDSETLAPMSSLLSMISHNADDMHRLLTSQAGAMPSQGMSHDTDSGLHADFGDNHLLDTAEGTVMQCLQEDTSISPSQGEIDALPSPPLQPHATSPDASPGNPNSAQEVDVVDIVEDGDEAEATASSLLGGDTVGNVTSLNALVDTENNVLSPATTSLQTLAPPDSTQENQPALTAVFDFVLQPKSVKVTRPCEVDQNRIMRAANVPAYPALDGAPTNKGRYCVDCNKMYRGDDGCTTHSVSYAIISDSPIPSRARRSIPSQLTLRAINNQTAPNFMGVIVLESIASHTLFGPLLGKKTTKELLERPTETAYVWELFDDGRQSQVLDCRNEEKSNWLMFVKRARTTAEQNVMVYQQQDDIYFVTCKDIRPGTELLYWYARDYAKMLGVAWRPEDFFKCPTCSKQFPDVNSVKQHVRYAHPDMTRRNCKCQLCGHAFTCASKLKTHMLSHMGVKPHKCQYCGKQFTDGSNLRMHLRLHTGERKFACKLCKRTFRQKAHLDMHQLTHTGEKRLQCLFCERMFARASEVKQHEYMHTREKLFQCTHENCSKVFWKLQNYKRHLKVHMGVREFTCAKCQKSFATSFHMKRHMGVCKGPKSDTRKELNAQTGAELGLSIAKRRIQKRHSVNFKETETTWECPL